MSRAFEGKSETTAAPAEIPCAKRSPQADITEDVRKYAAEQGLAEEGALAKGIAEKSAEFVEKGAAVYATA